MLLALRRPVLDKPRAQVLGLLEKERQAVPCSLRSDEVVLRWGRKRLLVNVVAQLCKLKDDLVWLQRVLVVLALVVVPLVV